MYPFSPKLPSRPGCHITPGQSSVCSTVGPCWLANTFFLMLTYSFNFVCAGSSLLRGLLSGCSARASCCVAFPVGEHRLWGCRASVAVARGLSSCSSRPRARLGCPAACGIFSHQGPNLCLLRWQVGTSPLTHQGSPLPVWFFFF